MTSREVLNGDQFPMRLYHGTSASSAEGIRSSGLRPSKGKIGMQHISGTLTDRREEAEKYAGPIGEVVSFDIPAEHTAKYLHEPQRNLDDTATHYPLRRTLPARYVSDDQ